MEFDTVVQALADGAGEFVLIGGVATQLHGSAMLTSDVDIRYSRSTADMRRLTTA